MADSEGVARQQTDKDFGRKWLDKGAKKIVDSPCCVMLTSLFIMLVLTVIGQSLGIVIDAGGSSFRAETDETALNFDAVTVGTLDVIAPPKEPDFVQLERSLPYGSLTLIYEPADGSSVTSMTSVAGLKGICAIEKKITTHADFAKFCLRGEAPAYDGKCAAPVSQLSMILPLDPATGLPVYNCDAITQADADSLLANLTSDGTSRPKPTAVSVPNTALRGGVDAGYFTVKGTTPSSTGTPYARSLMTWGFPLKGYNNTDNPSHSLRGAPSMRASDEQVNKFQAWVAGLLPVLEDASTSDVELRFRGTWVNDLVFEKILLDDTLFSIGSLLFVFLYVWFHLGSLPIAAAGIFGVVMSLPVAMFVYRGVLGIVRFGTLNMLGFFVVLGIGADDIFISRDAYVQAKHLAKPGDKYSRMQIAYHRSVSAMFITTLTTALSFAGNIVSIIPPVREFGIFMSVLVICNYIIVCTWFPSVMLAIENLKDKCGRKGKDSDGAESDGAGSTGDASAGGVELVEVAGKPATDGAPAAATNGSSTPAGESEVAHAAFQGRRMERYFSGPHTQFLHKRRIPVLAVGVVLFGVAIGLATQVETSEDPAQFLPDDHPFWRSVVLRREFVEPSKAINDGNNGNVIPTSVDFDIVFGIQGIDREDIDLTDTTDVGDVVWDTAFDITDPAAQSHILAYCDALEKQTFIVRKMKSCFARPWKKWLEDTHGLTLPLPAANRSDTTVLLKAWMTSVGPAFKNPYVTDVAIERSSNPAAKPVLKFVKIVAESSLKPFTPALTVAPLYDDLDAFVDAQNAKAPATAKAMMSSFWWMIMRTESVLVDTAILCATVSVVLAFLLLLVGTRNWVIATASTLCILFVVALVLAFMVLTDQKIGIIESINLTILVGISVDYSVHLAVAYGVHAHGSRFNRMREALGSMGISVFSAAITTIGSAAFLCLAAVRFFVLFGIFIVAALTASGLVAFVVLPATLFLVGPEDGPKAAAGDGTDAATSAAAATASGYDKDKDKAKAVEAPVVITDV